MKKILNLLLVITTMFSLCSCSSFVKKGDDLFKVGKYKEAREMYELALKKDPTDKKAMEAKEKAEFEYSNKILIKIRNLRTANKYEKAISRAKDLNDTLEKWDTDLSSNMASYYVKEMRKLFPHYLSMIDSAIEKNQPFKASFLYEYYIKLFQTYDFKKHLPEKVSKFMPLGKRFCTTHLKKGMEYPYWRTLLRKICQHFKVTTIKSIKETTRTGTKLYKKALVRDRLFRMDSSVRSQVLSLLPDTFNKSPWFHISSNKNAIITASGSYLYYSHESKEEREKTYYDDKNKEKTKSYYITTWDESIRLKLNLVTKISRKKIFTNFNQGKSQTISEHDSETNTGSMIPKNIVESKWLTQNLSLLSALLTADLHKKYEEKFCQNLGTGDSLYENGNKVILCLRSKNELFNIDINKWYKKHFSLTHQQLKELIGAYYK